MKQSFMLSYLDAFLYATLFIMVAFPLIFITKNRRIGGEHASAAAEAH